MATKTRVIFNSEKLRKAMLDAAVKEQNKRLVDYAKREIKVLGDRIQTYHSANNMDRTGNLLNSLCWVVTYDGKIVGSGFYRNPVLHSRGLEGGTSSYLHEFFSNDMEYVDGRQRAEEFISSKSNGDDSTSKWKIYFAILAPYWGYWEGGFTMKSGGSTVYQGNSRERKIPLTRRFLRHQVMTYVYDDVRMSLKPAEVHLSVFIPKYAYKNPRYKNKKGVKRIGVLR